MSDTQTHDTLIVGAGLSGICMAWHHRRARPQDDLALVEARSAIGGTWDLFRYPGIRSDSDMATLGYTFRPWLGKKAITDGDSIRDYISNVARESGMLERITFERRVVSADFDSNRQRWTVTLQVADSDQREVRHCRFLIMCTGYYDYAQGYQPAFPGIEQFTGPVIQPQLWPEGLDVGDKRIALIGSGATAVTLLPELAREAQHVALVQRTPTYIADLPSTDLWSRRFIRWFGSRGGHWLTRWKNILYTMGIFQLSRRAPKLIRKRLSEQVREHVGDHLDVDRHFSPPYNPWDQRLCIAPDGDFFEPFKSGRASIHTDQIDHFDERGLVLQSGERVDADIVVSATGLKLLIGGGAALCVDGVPVSLPETMTYKGAMLAGIPNLIITMGYTNASWTLKSELIARWSVRLLRYMDRHGYSMVVPRADGLSGERPLIDLDSGYIRRASAVLPKQGSRRPWTVNQNYFLDLKAFRWSRIDDGALRFAADG